MNFLSHFYFDGQAHNPYFNLGLVMPEFMGMVKRGWKMRPSELPAPARENDAELMKGVQYHLRMDKVFHNSWFFRENTELIRNYLLANGINGPNFRLFFVSHIMLELLMDRVLVKCRRSVVEEFYAELSAIDLRQVRDFFQAEALVYHEAFDDFFHRFLTDRFIFRYADDKAFFQALNRIFQRAQQPTFDDRQIQALQDSLAFLDKLMSDNFEQLEIELAR